MGNLLKPNVFVTRRIAEAALDRLRSAAEVEIWPEPTPPLHSELLARLPRLDAILTMVSDKLDRGAIARAPRLRAISNLAVGLDNIDLEAATSSGIAVGHTPGVLTETTADLAFALLMAAARRIVEAGRYVRDGQWRAWGPEVMLGCDIFGATLGIIGWGPIGQAMARRGLGFGMRVLFFTRQTRPSSPGAAERASLDGLLRASDFISLHCALTRDSYHLLGAREFALMKPGAIVVNTARGAVIDQKALTESLARGHLGGAGLDVLDREPIDPADPLLQLPNVVITPHIGSASHATRLKMAQTAVDNIIAVLQGKLPRFCANPAVKLRHVPSH